jgi:L-amino acid N-acyltransferase YncA
MGTYRFDEMSEKYIEDVSRIYNFYILNTTATFHTRELSDKEVGKIVQSGNERFKAYVTLDDDLVCGYSFLAPYKKREAYDSTAEITVYLEPEYIGRGIGSLTLGFLEKVAVEKGFHVLLAVICGENDQSIKLFSKNGFEKCGHYKEVGKKFGRLLDIVSYQKII